MSKWFYTCLCLCERIDVRTYVCMSVTCYPDPTQDQMLICDRCDRGVRMYCNVPVLHAVPEGDYSCPLCAQNIQPKKSKQGGGDVLNDSDDDEY